MKNPIIPIAATVVALLTISACKKDEANGGILPPVGNSPLRDLFTDHITQETQTFTVDATQGGTVTGANGTRVTFPPNGFRHANGTVVSGTVQVKLLEALKIGDMIWINTQTVGDDNGTDRLLRSGGELRVTATQNDNELQLGPNGMSVMVPTENPDPLMALFTANAPRDSGMVWTPVDSSNLTVVSDTSLNTNFYWFTTDSLQWINCDYFYNYPATTSLSATLPDGQPEDSTMVWIAFPSENAVTGLNYLTEQDLFTSWRVVPVGMQATVVGLYRNGSQYYSAFSTVSITDMMSVPLTFSPTTLDQFQQDIDGI